MKAKPFEKSANNATLQARTQEALESWDKGEGVVLAAYSAKNPAAKTTCQIDAQELARRTEQDRARWERWRKESDSTSA